MPTSAPTSSLLSEVSTAELMRNTTAISQWIRLSAMPEEWAAADYVRDTLNAYGVATRVHEAEIAIVMSAAFEIDTAVHGDDVGG